MLCVVGRIIVDDDHFIALVVADCLGKDAVERLSQAAAPIVGADAYRDVPLSRVQCRTVGHETTPMKEEPINFLGIRIATPRVAPPGFPVCDRAQSGRASGRYAERCLSGSTGREPPDRSSRISIPARENAGA